MSYCRWSSDNWHCDLYCYEDCAGGWTTHVAGRRIADGIPIVTFPGPDATPEEWATYVKGHSDQMEWLEAHRDEMTNIGLPHDGESFNDATLEEFRDRLLSLRALGYRFPDQVLADVEAEMHEATP